MNGTEKKSSPRAFISPSSLVRLEGDAAFTGDGERLSEAEAPALSDRDFDQAMERLGPFKATDVFAVALSGGADSLLLALQMARWCSSRDLAFHTVTVDHTLRPDSGLEALWCNWQMGRRGIAHDSLIWKRNETGQQKKVTQSEARKARYALLDHWCQRQGVTHLCTGHHRDDQLETVLMRREKKSGPFGLAGMSMVVERPFGLLIRPLLGVPKAGLTRRLRDEEQPWLEDPSNSRTDYLRSRIRTVLGDMSPEECEQLCETTRALGQRRHDLERAANHYLLEHARVSPQGFVELGLEAGWLDEPENRDVLALAIRRSLQLLSDVEHLPDLKSCLDLLQPLQELAGNNQTAAGRSKPHFRQNLAGCIVQSRGRRALQILRENRGLPVVGLEAGEQRAPGQPVRWDARYDLCYNCELLLRWLQDSGVIADGNAKLSVERTALNAVRDATGKQFGQTVCQTLPALYVDGRCLAVALEAVVSEYEGVEYPVLPLFCAQNASIVPFEALMVRWKPKKSVIEHPFTVA
ncbi:tRNA lysidine(34) synthetase TilS [Kiloniella sp. b19]|uniref:tRNA lysidine(34) synthetase TilS n=1 Tax=Kiloniella sp. GXU_MW_B19 TaxID=3141326 RepID=UPI0031E3863B